MTTLSSIQKRQLFGTVAFALAALAGLAFWAVELRMSITSHDEREEEVLSTYQRRQLEIRSEVLRDLFHEIYQTGRTISLLPAIREAGGPNRSSAKDDVVAQGRLSPEAHRTLKQIYANLATSVQVSEIYFVMDGFEPQAGQVPFFMYDDAIASPGAAVAQTPGSDSPQEDETFEYAQIVRQLDWFRANAPRFVYANDLNAIPAQFSPKVLTCDITQYSSIREGNPRDADGLVFSIPAYGADSGMFKGQVSIILRTNVLEARLLGVPFLPITADDQRRMRAAGWQMPAPSQFVLTEATQSIEIADRRHPMLANGLAAAKANRSDNGRWASHQVDVPGSGKWELHHHLTDVEIEPLVAGIRNSRQLSVVSRALLLLVLLGFVAAGARLIRGSRRELVRMAHFDQLTGLPNRRLFFDRLETGMARARRNNSRMGLFFLDLSGLNAINDRHGHDGGDRLLIEVASRLGQRLRATDSISFGAPPQGHGADGNSMPGPVRVLLSRLGGDEFTILCEDLHTAGDLAVVAERIIDCVNERFTIGNETVEIGINLGAALYPDDAGDAERLLMSADSAMHECKATNARYVLFNEEMRQRAERQHALVLELMVAQEKQQFELFYQPKATITDGHVVSLEALIRWRHPTLGLVSPIEFIPICERNGMIIELGQWIVEQACRDLRRLAEAGHPGIKLSVNVSVRQLKHGGFVEFLERALRESATDAGRLILEMTESMVMEDLAKGRQALTALKDLGVSLALDDFGAGYSSMTYLQHLPLDSLKIDKSLVDGMVDARAIHVVQTVIRLAQGLSLKTIAEGVETEDQLALLGGLGCDMIQGYLLSRPAPLPVILEWLDARKP